MPFFLRFISHGDRTMLSWPAPPGHVTRGWTTHRPRLHRRASPSLTTRAAASVAVPCVMVAARRRLTCGGGLHGGFNEVSWRGEVDPSRDAAARYYAASSAGVGSSIDRGGSFLYRFVETDDHEVTAEANRVYDGSASEEEEAGDEEQLYVTMITRDLEGEARALEASVKAAKAEASEAARGLSIAEAEVENAERRLREGVEAAKSEAAAASRTLLAAEAKVVAAEKQLEKVEARMRDISKQLAAAEAAAAAAAEKSRADEEAKAAAEAERAARKKELDAAVAAARAEGEAIARAAAAAAVSAPTEGHLMTLGVKQGDVGNRIVAVGDLARAKLVVSHLAPLPETGKIFELFSTRGIGVYTGLFRGVRVSVLVAAAGTHALEFAVKECRAAVSGQMAVCRLGTCGLLDPELELGAVVVASPGSVLIRKEHDAHAKRVKGSTPLPPYTITTVVESDPALTKALSERLAANLGGEDGASTGMVTGLNCTSDAFHSSVGGAAREHFDEGEDGVICAILSGATTAASLEMETFHLLHLARCSKKVNGHPGVVAAAAAVGLARRDEDDDDDVDDVIRFSESDRNEHVERAAGLAVLEALVARDLDGAENPEKEGRDVDSGGDDVAPRLDAGETEGDSAAPRAASEAEPEVEVEADEGGAKDGDGRAGEKGGGVKGGPVDWVRAYMAKSKEMAAQVKALGMAGVTAYGIFNTVYYTLAFTAAWAFTTVPADAGFLGTWKLAGKVLGVVWAGSQVTKLLRFALAIAAAPKVDGLMKWAVKKTGKSYRAMFLIITVGCFLASAALFATMIAARAVRL